MSVCKAFIRAFSVFLLAAALSFHLAAVSNGAETKKSSSKDKKKSAQPEKANKQRHDAEKGSVKDQEKKAGTAKKSVKTAGEAKDQASSSSAEVVINSRTFKPGGLTLENPAPPEKGKDREKIEKIKQLASEVKQSYETARKDKPKKKHKLSLALPESYHDIDMKLAKQVIERVNLKSLAMFKTLYQPHIRTGKLKKAAGPAKTGEGELDGRLKMTLFIVGSFINEVIEKYDTGTITKHHKDFGKWINEGAHILAYGGAYSMKIPVEGKAVKKGEKGGVITLAAAKKMLRALIETESSGVQMRGGKVFIGLNMSTYPREGSYVIGFMQESVDDFARGVNLFDPEVNIKYTCRKLHGYLARNGGNIDRVLRIYNAGAGNMDCAQAHRYSAKVMGRMDNY